MSIISKVKVFFGFIPETSSVESRRTALQKEYDDYHAFAKSPELAHYEELKKFVTDSAFTEAKSKIMAQKFSDTTEYEKEQAYLALKKSAAFKTYFKVKTSSKLADFIHTEGSSELAEYIKLEKKVNTQAFVEKQNSMPAKEFKLSDDYATLESYNQLKKSSAIKFYYKYKLDSNYQEYLHIEGSKELDEYVALEKMVHSDEFRKVKEYMLISSKKKWLASDEYAKQQEYIQLNKSEKIVWYYKLEGTLKFDEIKNWKIVFEDDFDAKTKTIDQAKWITNYFYANKMLKDTYSIVMDKHLVTDGENLELKDSNLKIVTKKEHRKGNVWNPYAGFHPREFDYTSGVVNTGKSFRPQYGKIEIKAKMNDQQVGTHTAWLAGDQALPQVNIFKYEKNKLSLGIFWGQLSKKGIRKNVNTLLSGAKYGQDFHIFTLEWEPGKMTWYINELEAKTITTDVPEMPMYIALSSGLYGNVDETKLPATFDIDWVKVYSKN